MKNQCQGKSKRSGERCKRRAAIGRTVCVIHGGKSLKGQESPRFKNGQFSKYLPQQLQARFEEFEWQSNYGDLLSLQDDIIATDVRISQLVERLEGGNGKETWQELKQVIKRLKEALLTGDTKQVKNSMIGLNETITRGDQDYRSWQELFKVQLHRKRLVESERKYLIENRFMLRIDEAMLMISAIVDVLNRNVTDEGTLRIIRNELNKVGVRMGWI